MKTIPLRAGNAFQRFGVTLAGTYIQFRLRWLTRHGYYSVDLSRADGAPIALGRALHPEMNLLAGLNVELGRIVLEGEPATIANLGITNKLRWYPDE
ncbi:MAG: hypothetical protein AB7E55_09590 [Pigmentiphaga sp.]